MSGNSLQCTSSQLCAKCKKKTLVECKCPCGQIFCIKCRVPELHGCTFDFRLEQQKKLARENPVVTGEKLNKIS
jgi:hypothetical protein